MKYLTVLLLFLYIHCVFSENDLFNWEQCRHDDNECTRKRGEKVFDKAAHGMAEHGIDCIDPLTYSSLTIQSHEKVITILSHLNITGLAHTHLDNYRLNRTGGSEEFGLRLMLNINSDVKIKFIDPEKVYSGTQTIKARALVNTKYDFEEKTNDEGMTYFELEPEVTKCRTAYVDELTMNNELQESLENDSELQNSNELNALNSDFWKNTVCKVAEFGVAKLVQNMRLISRLMPTSAFPEDT